MNVSLRQKKKKKKKRVCCSVIKTGRGIILATPYSQVTVEHLE